MINFTGKPASSWVFLDNARTDIHSPRSACEKFCALCFSYFWEISYRINLRQNFHKASVNHLKNGKNLQFYIFLQSNLCSMVYSIDSMLVKVLSRKPTCSNVFYFKLKRLSVYCKLNIDYQIQNNERTHTLCFMEGEVMIR